jgi:hypothetical protein
MTSTIFNSAGRSAARAEGTLSERNANVHTSRDFEDFRFIVDSSSFFTRRLKDAAPDSFLAIGIQRLPVLHLCNPSDFIN